MMDYKIWENIKGFMAKEEAAHLHDLACELSRKGPIVEIGSYCGKSAYVIGSACKKNSSILYSVDHHKGSEEQQKGEEYFDPELYDEALQRVNTFPVFCRTLEQNNLEDTVVPVAASSETAGRMWKTPISMLFIDGGHSFEAAITDYQIWSPHIMSGGYLVIHDIFTDPAKGGQAPWQVYKEALSSRLYKEMNMIMTLGCLQKK